MLDRRLITAARMMPHRVYTVRAKHGRLEMLFGTCNCLPVSHRLSRRNLLYAGGAGFVSTLVGTLAGTGRIARAQPLGSRVPEVDRLAVTIVTDTQIIKFIPTEKRLGLTIERRPGGNLRPDAPPRFDLVGEWGLSMHAQSQRGSEVRNILMILATCRKRSTTTSPFSSSIPQRLMLSY